MLTMCQEPVSVFYVHQFLHSSQQPYGLSTIIIIFFDRRYPEIVSHLPKVRVEAKSLTEAIRLQRSPYNVLVFSYDEVRKKPIYFYPNSANYKYAFVLDIFLLPLLIHTPHFSTLLCVLASGLYG